LADHVGGGQSPLSGPRDRHQADPVTVVDADEAPTGPGLGQGPLDHDQLAGRIAPLGGGRLREEAPEHLIGRPGDGGDRRDAEPLVDLRSPRVVDAGHDVRDLERLAGDAGGEDVGVVT